MRVPPPPNVVPAAPRTPQGKPRNPGPPLDIKTPAESGPQGPVDAAPMPAPILPPLHLAPAPARRFGPFVAPQGPMSGEWRWYRFDEQPATAVSVVFDPAHVVASAFDSKPRSKRWQPRAERPRALAIADGFADIWRTFWKGVSIDAERDRVRTRINPRLVRPATIRRATSADDLSIHPRHRRSMRVRRRRRLSRAAIRWLLCWRHRSTIALECLRL